ncbi:MAG: pyridoxamine 5'-phosphate oxidase family protein [Rickettsiales bacterium]|jgi:general stress protein 26|nr:pyridoxamine 5'-phosphate oxidase family protein [Rickettsiales bacterium]
MNSEIKSTVEVIKSCDTVQFCTFGLDEYPETRTILNKMNEDISDLSMLHFMTARGLPKYRQMEANPHACLYYFNAGTRMSVRLFGTAREIDDAGQRAAYWRDGFEKFGYAGPDDPDFVLIGFKPESYKFYIGEEEHSGPIA